MTNQPKEWTLIERGCGDPTYVIGPELKVGDKIHVIEAAPVLEKIRRLELALEKCKEQRDLYLCKDTNESEGIFDERIEFNAELELILEGRGC